MHWLLQTMSLPYVLLLLAKIWVPLVSFLVWKLFDIPQLCIYLNNATWWICFVYSNLTRMLSVPPLLLIPRHHCLFMMIYSYTLHFIVPWLVAYSILLSLGLISSLLSIKQLNASLHLLIRRYVQSSIFFSSLFHGLTFHHNSSPHLTTYLNGDQATDVSICHSITSGCVFLGATLSIGLLRNKLLSPDLVPRQSIVPLHI